MRSGTTGTLTITGHENGQPWPALCTTPRRSQRSWAAVEPTRSICRRSAVRQRQVAGLSILGGANTTIELSNSEINYHQRCCCQRVRCLEQRCGSRRCRVRTRSGWRRWPHQHGRLPRHADGEPAVLDQRSQSDQTADIKVINAPDGLNFDFNDTNLNAHAFSAIGSDTAGGAGNILNVNYLDLGMGDFFTARSQAAELRLCERQLDRRSVSRR